MKDAGTILKQLQRIATDNHRCFGCGYEHNCSIHGCAIIRDAAELLGDLQTSLQNSEVARSDLGKRLAAAQQQLHETKSELEAAVHGQETLQKAYSDVLCEKEQLIKELAGCIDCCNACVHVSDANPECDCDCEKCTVECHCKTCRDGSNFVWKGMAHGKA